MEKLKSYLSDLKDIILDLFGEEAEESLRETSNEKGTFAYVCLFAFYMFIGVVGGLLGLLVGFGIVFGIAFLVGLGVDTGYYFFTGERIFLLDLWLPVWFGLLFVLVKILKS